MLCFNLTVEFPLTVPVLSWLSSACRETTPSREEKRAKLSPSTGGRSKVRLRPTREAPSLHQPALRPPASDNSPTDPTLRPNPFPEVTDPFFRIPLPTLFHQLEAVHLGDLVRLSVRPGARIARALGFSLAVESVPDTTTSVVLYRTFNPISSQSDCRVPVRSSRGSRRRLQVRSRRRREYQGPIRIPVREC